MGTVTYIELRTEQRLESAIEAKARRIARQHGCIARKSRRAIGPDNSDGFAIIDLYYNVPIAGAQFDMSAEDVIAFFTS